MIIHPMATMIAGISLMIVLGVAFAMRHRLRTPGPAEIAKILAAMGPTHCQLAERFLTSIATVSSHEIAIAWNYLEMPLLAALPDCPPDLKPALAEALRACAAGCQVRNAAKRIMAVRNRLV